MRRREFITLAGGAAAAWSFAARAQQPTMPVIGFLHLTSPEETREYLAAFRKGLGYTGFVEGSNVRIEYRWGDGKNDRLAALLAELVERQVSVLVVLESTLGALAAKAATQSIPIVFMQGADPVRIGLVRSLNHPEGNLTGINLFLAEVAGRRLQFLRESVPSANLIGYLRNSSNPVFAESEGMEVRAAARDLGVSLVFANAGNLVEIDQAFANFASERVDALFVSADGFLLTHSDHIVALATRSGIPAIYGWRQAVTLGGLMSYGTNFPDAWRQAGIYTGRILKGEKPADLPVQQVTKIELIVNLKTAKASGFTLPLSLLGRADEVIE
jgi:putative ABC transport system substrate-binding protein